MAADPSLIIAKRSTKLSISYVVLGAALSAMGIVLGNIEQALANLSIPASSNNASSVEIQSILPLVSIPMITFGALGIATSVIMLYVYDKNNGVLEYFLSLGMDQGEIYSRYLKASLLLASILLVFALIANAGVGLILGTHGIVLLQVSILTPVIALSSVAFVNILMMAFSSLQKQRVGSNQPLGIALGFFVVFPSYILPFIMPSFAIVIDLAVAACVFGLSLGMFTASSRLIKREKLLP